MVDTKNKSKEEDCPLGLIKIAKTKWQKTVAIELVEMKKDIEWLKWMIKGVFTVSVISLIAGIIAQFI